MRDADEWMQERGAGSEGDDDSGLVSEEARTLQREDEPPLPGLAELLGANERGELHDLGPGMILHGKWELLELLGEGSFGQVYEARHVKMGHRVAVKVLGKTAGPKAKQRFLEEAQLMSGLSSEHLIRASDYDELDDGTPYFVMDLVKGKSLRHWLKERLPLGRAVELGEQILTGLVEVHRRGVVHGDVKPENVVIGADNDKARLLDFGLAQTSAAEAEGLGGTPCYMAPEMLLDRRPATVRTDVYAAGVVLYEMLTGRLPRGHLGMDAEQLRDEWKVRRRADPVLMHCTQVPEVQREALETLDRLVMDTLSPEPTQRPKSAMPMLTELGTLRRKLSPDAVASTLSVDGAGAPAVADSEVKSTAPLPPVETGRRGKRRWLWPAAVGVAALVVLVGWWVWSPDVDVDVDPDPPVIPMPVTQIEAARGGILVAVPEAASETVATAYEALCIALGGNRPPVEGILPVVCSSVSLQGDALMALVDEAGVRVVVQVGDEDAEQIVVRSTTHHRGNVLLAQLDGLELPTTPEAVEMVAPVLGAVVDPTSSTELDLEAFDWMVVGARWGVLAEVLRVEQGHSDHDDARRREELARTLERMRAGGWDKGSAFYGDLAALVWAGSQRCTESKPILRELSTKDDGIPILRSVALSYRARCLLEGEDPASRAGQAEELVDEALALSDDPCLRVEMIGTISWIDRWKGGDALWTANVDHLPSRTSCDPASWSQRLAVRGDALADSERWCHAVEAYAQAYGALRTEIVPLLNWAEYAWACSPGREVSREQILVELDAALESESFSRPQHQVSLSFMRWWLGMEPGDAERVAKAYVSVEPGMFGLIPGVASSLEPEICKGAEGDACARRILSRPKGDGDDERLRSSLGLR